MSFSSKTLKEVKDELEEVAIQNFYEDHDFEILAGACEDAANSLVEYDECEGIVTDLNDAATNIRNTADEVEATDFIYRVNWSFI